MVSGQQLIDSLRPRFNLSPQGTMTEAGSLSREFQILQIGILNGRHGVTISAYDKINGRTSYAAWSSFRRTGGISRRILRPYAR